MSALLIVLLGLTIAANADTPAQATNNVYSNKTLSKTTTASGYYYDSRLKACVRYSITGKLVVPVNRGAGSTAHDVYGSAQIKAPRINISYTTNCSSWTYVKMKDVEVTTAIYGMNCQPSLSLGVSVPFSVGVGVGLTCSKKRTMTETSGMSGPRTSFPFVYDYTTIKVPSQHIGFTSDKRLTYCARIGIKIDATRPGSAHYDGPHRNLNFCGTWTNPYY